MIKKTDPTSPNTHDGIQITNSAGNLLMLCGNSRIYPPETKSLSYAIIE
ncbi:MAG: hypothetical protein HN472_04790 [Nitrospina sp.]|nr:hypothetical protein [Nitrospina sp.]MBT4047134.1 hypothetical protein [Nitrospina sp.]MBT4558533.1 hypothetical protein [Nitrospina sp.]